MQSMIWFSVRARTQQWLLLVWLAVSASAQSLAAAAPENYYLLVFNEAKPGLEQQYNEWYQQTHAPAVASALHAVDAQRYVSSALQSKPVRKYLVVYHLRTNDLAADLGGLRPPAHPEADPIAPDSGVSWIYKDLAPPITGAGPRQFHSGAPMKTYQMFVRNGPYPGQDAVYNEWYNTRHGPDMAATPGIVGAQRMIFVQSGNGSEKPPTLYLTMYTVVTDDLPAFYDAMGIRGKTFYMSKAWDPATSVHFTYEAIGPQITGR